MSSDRTRGHAVYRCVEDPAEAGNPFIEALPPVWSRKEVLEGLSRFLDTDGFERLRQARPEVRLNALYQIRHYYQPTLRDLDLALGMVSTIRSGYLNRNPVGINFVSTLKRGIAALADPGHDRDPEAIATGMAVTGVSGVGKTTSVRIALECFPRVIRHREYDGSPFLRHQVVWHKVNCPKQGGVIKLCKDIITSIDRLLGETYARKHGIRRLSNEDLELALIAVVNAHGIGLLVIDEIQNLMRASPTNRAVTLTFLTSLMNGLGVPLLFVGTKDAEPIIGDAVPTSRRTAGGFHSYPRFGLDDNFELFMSGLWMYQLVDDPVEFDTRKPDDPGRRRGERPPWVVLFFLYCRGIPDIAVKLFVETQRRALTDSMRGGRNTITADLVKAVWNSRFKLMHKHILAISKGREPSEPDFGNDLLALGKELDGSPEKADRGRATETARASADAPDGPESANLYNEMPDGLDQPNHKDREHPLSDHVGPHLPHVPSKTAKAKKLGASATKAELAEAARNPKGSTLAGVVREGGKHGLTPHKAIKHRGRKMKANAVGTSDPAGACASATVLE
jgi:hypothetical protein